MASTYTTNLHVELQGTGDNSGTWGTVLNTTALTIIDQCLGDVQAVSLSSSNVTLTTSQSQHNYFRLTGSLSANVTVTWPAIGRSNYVYNATTGSYSVTLANAGGGTTVVIPQGNGLFITQDPTNGVIADPIPFGTLQAIAGGTTIDLGTAPARNVSVTGSGWTCTSFGSSASTTSPVYLINFVAAGTLTYNATSMILPGSVSKSVAAGDSCFAVYLGSGNWRVIGYTAAAVPAGLGYAFIGKRVFTSTQSYTPTSGCRYIEVVCIGGGGGGGGVANNSGNHAGGGGGGGAEAYYLGAASSQTITIGAAGTAGSSSGGAGGSGGTTSFGSLCVANGGTGGSGSSSTGIFNGTAGGAGGALGTCTYGFPGFAGGSGEAAGSSGDDSAAGGMGGGRGGGTGGCRSSNGSTAGVAATGYGGGGGGAGNTANQSGAAGGDGYAGVCIITEYA